jgi:hypothetical protein
MFCASSANASFHEYLVTSELLVTHMNDTLERRLAISRNRLQARFL